MADLTRDATHRTPNQSASSHVIRACEIWVYELNAGNIKRQVARATITNFLRETLAFVWDAGPRKGIKFHEWWSVYLNVERNGPAFLPRPLARMDRSSLSYCAPDALEKLAPLLGGPISKKAIR